MRADSSATRVTQAAHCVGNASEMLGSSGRAILRTFTRNPDEHTEAPPHRALRRRRPRDGRLCAGARRLRRRAVHRTSGHGDAQLPLDGELAPNLLTGGLTVPLALLALALGAFG